MPRSSDTPGNGPVVVGVAPGRPSRDAVDYAAFLARSLGLPLRVVCVVAGGWPTPLSGGVDREYASFVAGKGAEEVTAVRELLAEVTPAEQRDSVEVTSVIGRSVARTLEGQAESLGAELLVVGAGSDGAWGHVVIGSAADRLLHSSPVPVAVATRGFRTSVDARITRLTVGFRDDATSVTALRRAAFRCRQMDATLRVVTFGVLGKTMYPPEVRGEEDVLAAYVEQASAAQAAALAPLRAEGALPEKVETETSCGRDWAEAVTRLRWNTEDVLMVGSSSAGVLSRVFLGSSAAKIVRHSPVPVIVVP